MAEGVPAGCANCPSRSRSTTGRRATKQTDQGGQGKAEAKEHEGLDLRHVRLSQCSTGGHALMDRLITDSSAGCAQWRAANCPSGDCHQPIQNGFHVG